MSLRSLKRHVSGRGESSGSSSPVNNDTYLATSAMSIKHLFDILDDEEGWDPTISSFTSVELFSKTLQPGDTISCIKAKALVKAAAEHIMETAWNINYDKSLLSEKIVHKISDQIDIQYQAFKYPFPARSRDYCKLRTRRVLPDGKHVLATTSVTHPLCPEKHGFVRAEAVIASYLIEPIPNKSACVVTYIVYIDPKGYIPPFIVNMYANSVAERLYKIQSMVKGVSNIASINSSSASASSSSSSNENNNSNHSNTNSNNSNNNAANNNAANNNAAANNNNNSNANNNNNNNNPLAGRTIPEELARIEQEWAKIGREWQALRDMRSTLSQGQPNTVSASNSDAINNDSVLIDPKTLVVGEKIGEGAFSEVFKGEWGGMQVAVKEVRGLSNTDSVNKEIAILKQLRHPHTLLFLGIVNEPEKPLRIVTEYLAKGNLYDLLHVKMHPLSTKMKIKIAKQLALGLNHLHSLKIIHRDFKTPNILLDEYFNAKIADMGLSRVFSNAPMTVGRIGTPQWMAPELLSEASDYDEKVDTYSYGVVLWEIFTGTVPFNGMTAIQIALKVINNNGRPSPMPMNCPPALTSLIERCWATQASARPSFKEIIDTWTEIEKDMMNMLYEETNVPQALICPITTEVMKDPVVCEDGHSYERQAITDWFSRGNTTSPLTRQQIFGTMVPNLNLRALIREFQQEDNNGLI